MRERRRIWSQKAKGEQIDLLHQYIPPLFELPTAQLEFVVLPLVWEATGLEITNFKSLIAAMQEVIISYIPQKLTGEVILKSAIITSIHLGISNMHPDTFTQDLQGKLDALLQEHSQK